MLKLVCLLCVFLIPISGFGELIEYRVSGVITSVSDVENDDLIGEDYEITMVYNTSVTGNGTYYDSILSGYLELAGMKLVIPPSNIAGNPVMKSFAGFRFEQNVILYSLKQNSGGSYSMMSSTEEGFVRMTAELVLRDTQRVYPESNAVPASLDLDDFENNFAEFTVNSKTVSGSIDAMSFRPFTNPFKLTDVQFLKGLLFSNVYGYSTVATVETTVPGLQYILYSSEDLSEWNGGSESSAYLVDSAQVSLERRVTSSVLSWPPSQKKFFQLQSSYLPAP